jgi:hypothetical protein
MGALWAIARIFRVRRTRIIAMPTISLKPSSFETVRSWPRGEWASLRKFFYASFAALNFP